MPFRTPAAKIPLTIRPFEEGDTVKLLDVKAPDVTKDGFYDRLQRLKLLKADIGTCYVAVTSDGYPCYMQWLMESKDNEKIQAYFKGVFPLLAPNEALLEAAFTPEAYRGLGIMPCAMSQIAEKGISLQARRVITFVERDGIPSLKGCKKAGFVPYTLRRDRWSLFRRQSTFINLPTRTPYPFDVETSTERSQET